ncbi:hypothetical protein P3T73_03075 [Kiritimatiellota bacterium B12222]|nr:hypothetical protein P3T73_03075 [Kiritimatiellota bacterium B12222]
MKYAFLLFAISLFMTGCPQNAERFEDLQKLSGSRWFVREIPDDFAAGASISFGFTEGSGEIQYLGDFIPEEGQDYVDLYFFSDPLRLGWACGSSLGSFPFALHQAEDVSTLVFGKENGSLSEPILRLSTAKAPAAEAFTSEGTLEFFLYITPTSSPPKK